MLIIKANSVFKLVFSALIIVLAVVVAFGNRINDEWHFLEHGYDQVTFDHRHFMNPESVSNRTSALIETGSSYHGEKIYVNSKSDLTRLPTNVYIKRKGQVLEYTLSGGF